MIPNARRCDGHGISAGILGFSVAATGFLLGATPAHALETEAPSIHDTVEYHDITGNTEADLGAALKRLPYAETSDDRSFAANTRWQLRWKFSVESAGGGCRLVSATTDLDVQMNLPRWKAPPFARPELVKRWDAFAAALRKHEDGHRDIAVAAAYEIVERAQKTQPASDCEAFKRRLSRIADATVREYRDKESSYDATTMHGRAQGASFP